MGSVISKSVGRIFEVFELFRKEQKPMRAVEIKSNLNYPQPSTLALMKNLVDLGYLAFDKKTKTYFPTRNFSRLGSWVDNALICQGWVARLVDDLSSELNETASIAGQSDLHTHIIYTRKPAHPHSLKIYKGIGGSLCATTIGRAILSQYTDDDIVQIVKDTNVYEMNAGSGINHDRAQIFESVDSIRDKGYLSAYDMFAPGVGVVVAPLTESNRANPLSIAIAGEAERIRQQEPHIIEQIRGTVDRYWQAKV